MAVASERFVIESDDLRVEVSSLGGELKSVKDIATGFEFLWQADTAVWGRTAPVLFPIVGKAAGDQIRVDGKSYPLTQHGFARDLVFECIERESNSVSLQLAASTHTRKHYPYDFLLILTYRVFGRKVTTTFDVLSREEERTIFYSIGGHPAFALPEADLSKFRLRFEQTEDLERHFLDGGLRTGELDNLGRGVAELRLSSELFDRDAVILKDIESRAVELVYSADHQYRIDVEFRKFPFLGIWTKPKCHSFVCIEPWFGLADQIDYEGELSEKEGILSLKPGELHSRAFTISFSPPRSSV